MTRELRILVAIAVLFGGVSQVRAQAFPCETFWLDPTVPGGIRVLERYYERSEGVGGLGCWVHPHRNGSDFVITPFSWGENPDAEHQAWIDRTMEAIQDSRSVLTRIGTLNVNLFIILTDLTSAGSGRDGAAEAYWLLDGDCWIEARQECRIDPSLPLAPEDRFKSCIAHEIGHCFLMENIPGYEPYAGDSPRGITVPWWDESGAEYLSAQVYPDLNHEFYYAGRFDLDGRRWLQVYTAYVVLQHYSNLNSQRAVIELLAWFHEQGEEVRPFLDAIYNHETFGDFFHDFAVTHYQSQVDDPGGGTTPREMLVDNFHERHLLPSSGTVLMDGVLANRLNIAELTIPAGYDLRLAPPTGSPKRFAKTLWENGRFQQGWNSTAHIAGSCDHDTQARVLMTHHFETQLDELEMTYWLDEKCPCGDQTISDCCRMPRTSDLQPGNDLRPYYTGPDPVQSLAACLFECNDTCWCQNKPMWSFEPVTKAECDRFWPDGTVRLAPNIPTMCEAMTHPKKRRPTAKKDVLHVHCEAVCSEVCPGGG